MTTFRRRACAIVDFGWALAHVLWICRISVASLTLGWVLFYFAPQARDLFRDVAGDLNGNTLEGSPFLNGVYGAGLFLSALVFWSIPVHTMGRWAIDLHFNFRGAAGGLPDVKTDQAPQPPAPDPNMSQEESDAAQSAWWRRVCIITWLPRLLGFLCFVLLGYGLFLTTGEKFDQKIIRTATLTDRQITITWISLIVGLFFYALYVMRHRLFAFFDRSGPIFAGARVSRMGLYGGIAATLALVAFIGWPGLFKFPGRIILAPLVLGGWVPLLTYLTTRSYKLNIPLLTIIVAAAIVAAWLRDVHPMRVLNGVRPSQLTIAQALDRWQRNNNCAGAADKCPSPIIVAASGGASRAAFTMASTLGMLMDATCIPNPASASDAVAPCGGHPVFSDRVFAISAVSGSALGAIVFAAALREYQDHPTPALSPCQAASTFWFKAGTPKTWRDCMQGILADDFLAPAVLGLAFRDQLPLANIYLDDRAAVLEETWSKTFAALVLKDVPSAEAAQRGLDTSFDSLLPTADGPWRPLLVLNGTSTGSGRRILTSHLPVGPPEHPLFADAYEVRDLLARGSAGNNGSASVRISTAALNSARFPLISPPGAIYDRNGNFIDRIVDGGYFENYGIVSAIELADALAAAGLHPSILLITNDPISPQRIEQLDYYNGSLLPLLPEDTQRLPVTGLTGPFLALYNTRSSRGDISAMAAGRASRRPADSPQPPVPFAEVTVYGEPVDGAANAPGAQERPDKYKDVSMSWWMSKPMQEYIDWQLVDPTVSCGLQQKMLRRVCDWLKPQAGTDDGLAARCKSGLDKSFAPLPPSCQNHGS